MHLDQFHGNLAGVAQAVAGSQGDVGALVLAHQFLDAVLLHQGGALHHHPVFSAMVVHLEREAGSGLHLDLLHLPAIPFHHAVVMAPGAVDAAVGLAFRGPLPFEAPHDRLHLLGPVAVGHQHHVVGFDHHQILHAEAHHEAVFTAEVAVAGVFADHPAPQYVALGILFPGFPESAPAAHIAPVGIERQHGAAVGFFHHGHIEGHIGTVGEGLPLQPQEFEVRAVLVEGGAAGAHHLRRQALQLREDGAGAEEEHAAVPGEAAGGEEGLGGGQIGLLHEAGDRHRRGGIEGLGGLDIAIARFRRRGHDAEGHQPTGLGGRDTGGHGGAEALGAVDHMVGRQDQQQGIGAAGGGLQGGDRHGGGGVAAEGFEEDAGRLHANLAQLLGHDEAVILVADQQGGRQLRQALQPQLGLLQQGVIALAGQGPVLLGITGAGEGPEAGAGAAAKDHRNQGGGGHGCRGVCSGTNRPHST